MNRLIEALRRHALGHLIRVVVAASIALTLYGVVPRATVAVALALFAGVRGLVLLRASLERPMADADRLAQPMADAETYAGLESGEADELARRATGFERPAHQPPRSRAELGCEALGLLTYVLLLPPTLMFFSRDFFPIRGSFDLPDLSTVGLCLAIYAWPFFWRPSAEARSRRMILWALPCVPVVVLFYVGLTVRHPYLDPTNPDRIRLAAEKVLALQSNVTAEAYSDWIFRHADAIAREGDTEAAISLYRRGLVLSPTSAAARQQLAALLGSELPGRPTSAADRNAIAARARAPLWEAGRRAPALRPCAVDDSLRSLRPITVVVVEAGAVDRAMIDAVGEVLQRELGLEVCLATASVPLPDATRLRGVVFGRQWSVESLVTAFAEHARPPDGLPHRYLIVTEADIYGAESNYVFSASFKWGAVLSNARYALTDARFDALVERTAKQALGAIVKAFGLPPASDPNCVTSYSNGPGQFDAKGNRPTRETLERLRSVIDRWQARWDARLGYG